MNTGAQQIAIAKACGWREAFPQKGDAHPETKRGGILLPYYWVNEITHERRMELPDYLNDLNAMHEAEKILDFAQMCMMGEILREIEMRTEQARGSFRWHTTAAQRAEAFLRTLGKWQD